jgi:hypothetical protein
MLPFCQLLKPNKSLQAFFLLEIDVVSQNCKTKNNPLTLRVIPEQFQFIEEITFRNSIILLTELLDAHIITCRGLMRVK